MGSYSLCLRALSCEFPKGSLILPQLFYIYMKSLEICETIWENYYTWYFVCFPTDSETMVTGLNQDWQESCFRQKPAGWKSTQKIWKRWWSANINTGGPGSGRSLKMVTYTSVISVLWHPNHTFGQLGETPEVPGSSIKLLLTARIVCSRGRNPLLHECQGHEDAIHKQVNSV